MLSECQFFHVSSVFDSKRKKQTNIPPIMKLQKSEKEHGEKCLSNMAELEDSSALGLLISVTLCQISSGFWAGIGLLLWERACKPSTLRCNERGILSLPPPSDYLNEEFSINIISYDAGFGTGPWSSFDITCCAASVLCWARGKQKVLPRISKIFQWNTEVITCHRISWTTLSNN